MRIARWVPDHKVRAFSIGWQDTFSVPEAKVKLLSHCHMSQCLRDPLSETRLNTSLLSDVLVLVRKRTDAQNRELRSIIPFRAVKSIPYIGFEMIPEAKLPNK